jgi:hypothetical protein
MKIQMINQITLNCLSDRKEEAHTSKHAISILKSISLFLSGIEINNQVN